MAAFVKGSPKPYKEFFTNFPADITTPEKPPHEGWDFIHIFETKLDKLEKTVSQLKPSLNKSGLMWVSWPKASSKIMTNIKRDPMRALVLKSGLVDIKVCAVDENWSGLKFVYRLEDR